MEEPMEIEFSSDNDDDLIMEVDKIEKMILMWNLVQLMKMKWFAN